MNLPRLDETMAEGAFEDFSDDSFVSRLHAALDEARVLYSRLFARAERPDLVMEALEDVGNRYVDMSETLSREWLTRKIEQHAVARRDS